MWDGIRDGLADWCRDGTRFALATVVRTQGSSPRSAGAAMAVSEHGDVLGSISGGCVEADVYERAGEVLATGNAEIVRYGVTDAEAFAVGLTCGGELEVFIEPIDDAAFPQIAIVLARIRDQVPVVLGTRLDVGQLAERHLVVADAASTAPSARRLQAVLGTTTSHVVEECEPGSEGRVFVQGHALPPRMIIFGAVDFAVALSGLGSFLGYRVTVCDARPVFATPSRFPAADEVVVDWPHRYLAQQQIDATTVLCVLTHDPKFDVPLLKVALETPATYIGVMGSRRSHEDRVRRLRDVGVPVASLQRLRSPIGLDLGGRTPEETAVSIAAEIIAAATGRTAQPLSDVPWDIHDIAAIGG
ncbi:MAG: XshC-Cox1 family protein [Marmoricola sp.]|nr:XshC-Cox1 family protein [Marmoricola sp.]